jgi:hypothetical protein
MNWLWLGGCALHFQVLHACSASTSALSMCCNNSVCTRRLGNHATYISHVCE